jgi:Tol biopolymer transport system component
MDVKTGKRRTIPHAIYHISPNGKWALGTDFSRIHDMRPGYGYAGIPDSNRDVTTPTGSGIYLVNLDSGEYKFLFSVADIAKFRYGGESAEHKLYFNHVAWSSNGKRFLFFNRGQGVRTHVYTAAADGTDVRFLAEKSSHFAWRDPRHVLIWSEGAYRLYKDDGSGNGRVVWEAPNGHVSYLPDSNWVVTDTYPRGDERQQEVYLYHIPSGKKLSLGRFHSPVQYKGEWRCDTHPRVSPNGKKVVIDSAHGGNGRQMYLIDISRITTCMREK